MSRPPLLVVMLGFVLAVVLLPLVVFVASSTAAGKCKGGAYCVKRVYQDQTWTFEGRHWKPGKVRVTYNTYCAPGGPCAGTADGKVIQASKKGRFTFHLLVGNQVLPGVAHGAGPITFGQGRHHRTFELLSLNFKEAVGVMPPPTVNLIPTVDVTPTLDVTPGTWIPCVSCTTLTPTLDVTPIVSEP